MSERKKYAKRRWATSRAIDLTSQRFGKLTAIRRAGIRNSNAIWLVRCDCGNEKMVLSHNLKAGTTISCGCSRAPKGSLSHHWQGLNDITGDHWNRIKATAKYRNISFGIDLEYGWDLFINQNRRCALSGVELLFGSYGKNKSETTASLDRIDSKLGYSRGNVQWVHKWVNLMKNNHPQEDFLDWVSKIHNCSNHP